MFIINTSIKWVPVVWVFAIEFVILGQFVVRDVISFLRRKHEIYRNFENIDSSQENEKDDYSRSTFLLGSLELTVYFILTVVGLEVFIGWWLVVKTAGRWNQGGVPQEIEPVEKWDLFPVKKKKRQRAAAALNIFLIGNLLNIIFGVGGGLIAKHSCDISEFILSIWN